MAVGKLKWDQSGSRFYELGCDRGVLYVQSTTETNADGSAKYEGGVAWSGLTKVTESPDGAEANDMYADNMKYGSIRSAETFKATIEAYTYPKEFGPCDGSAEVGSGVYFGQQTRVPFGFTYRTKIQNDTASKSDDGYIIHIVYNATVSPSEKDYETINDSPEAATFSWELETNPIAVDGYEATALVTVKSTECTAEVLKKIEDALYGTADSEPTLLLPDEILALLGKAAG